MRPIPAPRNPDALPMPEGDSRDWVTHPGAKQAKRYALVPCHVRHAQLNLGKGATLLDAVALGRDLLGIASQRTTVFACLEGDAAQLA